MKQFYKLLSRSAGNILTYRLADDSVRLLGPGKSTSTNNPRLPRTSSQGVGVVRNPGLDRLGVGIFSRFGGPNRNLLGGDISPGSSASSSTRNPCQGLRTGDIGLHCG